MAGAAGITPVGPGSERRVSWGSRVVMELDTGEGSFESLTGLSEGTLTTAGRMEEPAVFR